MINVKDFGAVGDGQADDTAAFAAASAAARTAQAALFVPKPTGYYRVADTVHAWFGIVGEYGALIQAAQASPFADGRAIVRVGWSRAEKAADASLPDLCIGAPVSGISVKGAGTRTATRSAEQSSMGFNGTGILLDELTFAIVGRDARVEFCRYGVEFANVNGHLSFDGLFAANNWYNCYWTSNTGDYGLRDSVLTGALFASLGMSGTNSRDDRPGGIAGLLLERVHLGFGPYGIYQEDGNGAVGLSGLSTIDCRFEAIGNRCIRIGGGTVKNSSDWTIISPGHSWVSESPAEQASYVLIGDPAHPVRDYAIVLALAQGGPIRVEGNGFLKGTSGFHTRIDSLIGWIDDDNGPAGYKITTQGQERLIHQPAQVYRDQHAVPPTTLDPSGSLTSIATFGVPQQLDGTVYGYVRLNLSYSNAGPLQIGHVKVSAHGANGGAPQTVGPQLYFQAGRGNLVTDFRFELGRYDPASPKPRVEVQLYGGGSNVSLSPDGLNGTAELTVGQFTGVV